jgi:hypothetical protein
MKLLDIGITTEITDFENFFKIHEDSRTGYYKYNLNEGLYINVDKSQCEEYILKTDAFWPLISYKIYETPKLAWLLMKLNDVSGEDIFKKKTPGSTIYYLPKETV